MPAVPMALLSPVPILWVESDQDGLATYWGREGDDLPDEFI